MQTFTACSISGHFDHQLFLVVDIGEVQHDSAIGTVHVADIGFDSGEVCFVISTDFSQHCTWPVAFTSSAVECELFSHPDLKDVDERIGEHFRA